MDALATVVYAGTKKNLVESGMVADTPSINGMKVRVVLEFPRDTDPFLKSTVKAAEAAIHYHVSKDVEVEIVTEFKSKPRPKDEDLLPGVSHIVAVSSGKGGVGKSTVAVNLAVALARLGYRVGLLDTDIFGPSIPKMLGTEDAKVYAVNKDGRDLIEPVEKYGVRFLSIGFFVAPTTATLWRGGMACNALKQLLADADWGELDYLILDTPPGTSDIHLSLIQTLKLTGAVIVSTPRRSRWRWPMPARVSTCTRTRRWACPSWGWWRTWRGSRLPSCPRTAIISLAVRAASGWPRRWACPCWRRYRWCRASATMAMRERRQSPI